MDLREVCTFFGGSIFHEELRCNFDFSDFKTRLDILQRPEGATDAEMSLVRGLLASIVSILRGQVEDAEVNITLLLHAIIGER